MAPDVSPGLPDISVMTDSEKLDEILARLRQAEALMVAWRIGGLRGLLSAVKGGTNGQG
jgi:hypothetical protein